MNFRPELAAKVLAGEKTVTRRLVSDNPRSPWFEGGCKLVVGRDYAVCPGRGKNAIGRVRIVSVRREFLGHLAFTQARAEGFANGREFVKAWSSINGSYDPTAIVWRVEFKPVPTWLVDDPDGQIGERCWISAAPFASPAAAVEYANAHGGDALDDLAREGLELHHVEPSRWMRPDGAGGWTDCRRDDDGAVEFFAFELGDIE